MNCIKKLTLTMAAVSLCAFSVASQAEWKGWNIHVKGYPNTVAMDNFADLIKEKSDGKLTLKNFHNGVLGSQPDAIEQLRIGGLQVASFSLGPIGPIVPEANVLSLPFIFKDPEHMFRVMDGEGGKIINEGMKKKGIVLLGVYDAGARSFYNGTKAIEKPEDVKGMKIRVMNNDLYSGMISALGGNPSPMAFSEVYQSLKTKVVDGAENNFPSYESTAHNEVAQFYSLSQHLIIPECLCMNADVYAALSDEEKKIVHEAADESTALQRAEWAKRDVASRETVEANGVKVNEIADKSGFQDAMKPVYATYLEANPDLKSLVKLIQDTP